MLIRRSRRNNIRTTLINKTKTKNTMTKQNSHTHNNKTKNDNMRKKRRSLITGRMMKIWSTKIRRIRLITTRRIMIL